MAAINGVPESLKYGVRALTNSVAPRQTPHYPWLGWAGTLLFIGESGSARILGGHEYALSFFLLPNGIRDPGGLRDSV